MPWWGWLIAVAPIWVLFMALGLAIVRAAWISGGKPRNKRP
jgi:hypothetical protein